MEIWLCCRCTSQGGSSLFYHFEGIFGDALQTLKDTLAIFLDKGLLAKFSLQWGWSHAPLLKRILTTLQQCQIHILELSRKSSKFLYDNAPKYRTVLHFSVPQFCIFTAALLQYLKDCYGPPRANHDGEMEPERSGEDMLWNPQNHTLLTDEDFSVLRDKYNVTPWKFTQRAVSNSLPKNIAVIP